MADLSRPSGDGAKADSGNGDLPRRVAWWLVWAYPPRFRRDVGQGLVDALDDRMRARRAAGASSAAVWARAIADTLRNATAEWVDEIQRVRREVRLKPDTTYTHASHQEPSRAENPTYVVSGFSRTSD